MTLVPEIVAAWQRIRAGHDPLAGGPGGSHAARFLYLLNGREPSPEVARTMDVVLTLHADHEFNASTFAARVAVATMADLHAAIVSAIATLKGPRHGGANDDVLAMLHQIEDPARAEAFVEARIGGRAGMSKRERSNPTTRMPGFGHRVYRVDDARARVLRGMAKEMAAATGRERLFEVAEGVYGAMRARTTLPVNVDFFSAVVHDPRGLRGVGSESPRHRGRLEREGVGDAPGSARRRDGIGEVGFGKALLAEKTGVAPSAGAAIALRLVARPGE